MKFPECEECGSHLIPELMECPKCGIDADHPIPTELRCECGFLLCKLAEDAIEVKCRRCKRLAYIPIEDLPDRFETLKNRKETRPERPAYKKPGGHQEHKGQYCSGCGQFKPNVMYGKCLDCRTESIKIQYRSRTRQ